MPLHLVKLAVGIDDIDQLRAIRKARTAERFSREPSVGVMTPGDLEPLPEKQLGGLSNEDG